MTTHRAALLLAASLFLSSAARARGSAEADGSEFEGTGETREWNDWVIRFEAMVWVPALRGDIKMPSGASFGSEDLNIDGPEITPAGRVTIRADKWSFVFRGFAFSVDADAASIDLAGFDLTAGYTVWTPINDAERETRLAFDVFGGARLHSLDATLGAEQADNTWFEPIVGGRINLDLPHRFGVYFSGDGGGFTSGDDSSFSFDFTVALSWMPIENVGIEVGYRYLQVDLVEGGGPADFEFDAALAGLFGAVVIRF